MKILIVEDQHYPFELLSMVVKTLAENLFSSFSIDVARYFNDAKQKIERNEYNIILLDHRMPRTDVGNLEDEDFQRFSNSLQNIGYSLIPLIREKNPKCVIIGTSSLRSELESFPNPDHKIDKSYDPESELSPIFQSIAKTK
tara:strand:+ start:377 stop:802 length:426 start_codon:yes stop_codon:yes gene_type:complete